MTNGTPSMPGQERHEFDVVVFGGGSAGLAAARRARTLGAAQVAVIEKEILGGECSYTACMPVKALLRSAGALDEVRRAGELGVRVPGGALPDWPAMLRRVRAITGADEGDPPTEAGLRAQGIAVFRGEGEFAAGDQVRIGRHLLTARRFLLTSGSYDRTPPVDGLAEAGFLTHKDVFDLPELPRSVAIIGAGPVGVEFAEIFAPLGVEVTLLMSGPLPLPREDHDTSAALLALLRAEPNLRIEAGVRVERVACRPGGGKVVYARGAEQPAGPTPSGGGEPRALEFAVDEVFVAIGHAPAIDGIGLERAGVECGRMGVRVDAGLRTTSSLVWAAGDVTGVALFTHVASYQAKVAAHNAVLDLGGGAPSGAPIAADYRVVPRATFCRPEVASVGLTEEECRAGDVPYRAAKMPMAALDRARAASETEGVAKLLVADGGGPDAGQILGAHVIGARAGELIHQAAALMQNRVPADGIACTLHAFPTFSEVWEYLALELA